MRLAILAIVLSGCVITDAIDGDSHADTCGWTSSESAARACLAPYIPAPGECIFVDTIAFQHVVACWYPDGVPDRPGFPRARTGDE